MSEINSFSDNASKYNTNVDYSYLFGGMQRRHSFKTLFTGHNSFADKVSMKANSISNAAARSSGTYKSNGTYNNALSELVSKKVDEEV